MSFSEWGPKIGILSVLCKRDMVVDARQTSPGTFCRVYIVWHKKPKSISEHTRRWTLRQTSYSSRRAILGSFHCQPRTGNWGYSRLRLIPKLSEIHRLVPNQVKSLVSVSLSALRLIRNTRYCTQHCYLWYQMTDCTLLSLRRQTQWSVLVYKAILGQLLSSICPIYLQCCKQQAQIACILHF